MVNLREIRTAWTGPQGLSMLTVMYFEAPSVTVATQRAALSVFWQAVRADISSQYTYTIETAGRIIEDSSGELVGSWSEPTPYSAPGSAAGQPVPDASQVLLRWGTGQVVNGRFLKGRTFVPGLAVNFTSNGNVTPAVAAGIDTAQLAFVGAGSGFSVWQRPRPSSPEHPIYRPGQSRPVTSGTCWRELATQRNRRNR